jgi:hypothetical protein
LSLRRAACLGAIFLVAAARHGLAQETPAAAVSSVERDSAPSRLPNFELPYASPRLYGAAARAIYVSDADHKFGDGWDTELMMGENIPVIPFHRTPWSLALHVGFEVIGRFRLTDPQTSFIGSDWSFDVGLVAGLGSWMLAGQLTHYSSHIGDEYLREFTDTVSAFAGETMGAWAFYTTGPWRFGGNVTYVYATIRVGDPWIFQGGIDYTGHLGRSLGVRARPVAGVFAEWPGYAHWQAQLSAKVGIQAPLVNDHYFTLSVIGFTGPSTLSQFYNRYLSYAGIELRLDY